MCRQHTQLKERQCWATKTVTQTGPYKQPGFNKLTMAAARPLCVQVHRCLLDLSNLLTDT